MSIESHHKVSTLFVDVEEQFLVASADLYTETFVCVTAKNTLAST